ncbi:tape measure protein, partial [Methanobrevibacter sp.]|uniref:tape measure protein n=1 Tax=Methanobrevibacter sp. TaxID=66852 RepID=UPI00388F7606
MAKDNVDTKVVRMEFDNKQFEKNIKQTSKSLDNLKQSLDFKGVGDSIEKVKVKISALQIVATTFVATLTNKLINLSTVLVKSLSVDNIATGWAKFGDKTISVATMMAQKIRIAGQEITDLAEKTKVVNEQLELLAWFSDETSYSFTDMVNNAGKFIAAGQDLDTSVKAMEGIATWAALAGQNAATASRAMYQLAQAMGKGKIQKIDWMSIQNANMDTEEFRETILATAVALGKLTKEGNKFVTKTGKKFEKSQFADFLSEGWFTTDVLIEGLNKYSAAVEQIYEISERTGKTASEVIEEYGDQLDVFGVKAFKAAQEARTLADVLNSVRDAVSSKWMTTFEKVFGSQEDVVKFWTNLANELYEVFAESGNFRNNILDVWSSLGGSEDLFAKDGDHQGAFWNMFDAINAVVKLIKKAWNTVFPLSTMEKEADQASEIGVTLKNLTVQIREFTTSLKFAENTSSRLYKIFQATFTVLKAGTVILKTLRYVLDPIIELGKRLVGQVLDEIIYSTNKVIGVGSKIEKIAIKAQTIISNLIDALDIEGVLSQLFDWLHETYDLISSTGPIENAIKLVNSFIDTFKEAGGSLESIRKVILSVVYIFNLLKNTLLSVISVALNAILPIIDDLLEIAVKVAGYILGTLSKVIESVADMIITLVKAIQSGDSLSPIGDSINDILESIGTLAKGLIPVLGQLVPVILKFVKMLFMIPEMLNEISKKITGRGILDNLVYIFDNIISAITTFVEGLKKNASTGSLSGLFSAIMGVFEGLYELLKGLIASAQLILTIIGSALKTIGQALQMIADLFIKVFGGRTNELSTAQKSMWKTIVVLAALAGTIWLIYTIFYGVLSAVHPLSVVADS